MSTKPTFNELLKMGYFNVDPKIQPTTQKTRYGRTSKAPKRFIDEQFTGGSGCCYIPEKEPTDMKFNGTN